MVFSMLPRTNSLIDVRFVIAIYRQKKSASNEKIITGVFIVSFIAFSALRYNITARAFLQSTRCNKPDGQTSAQTEREPRRRRKHRLQ